MEIDQIVSDDVRSAADLSAALLDVLREQKYDDDGVIRSVTTYTDAGVLTMNEGIVLRLDNGAEFQITIVQSQRAADDDNESEI